LLDLGKRRNRAKARPHRNARMMGVPQGASMSRRAPNAVGMRWRKTVAAAIGLLLLGALAGPAQAQSRTAAEIANYIGTDRQKLLEDGARREGELLLYTTGTQIQPLMNRFSQKYPFIRLKFYRAGGAEVAQKVTIEYQASCFAVDAFELGSDSLLVPRPQGVLQPFTSPEMTAYPAESVDAQRYWVSARESYGGLSYNTKLIAAERAPGRPRSS